MGNTNLPSPPESWRVWDSLKLDVPPEKKMSTVKYHTVSDDRIWSEAVPADQAQARVVELMSVDHYDVDSIWIEDVRVVVTWKAERHTSEVEGVLMDPNLINALDDDRYLTEDKERITHGAVLFNYYDGYRVEVVIEGTWADPKNEFHEHWNGWFNTWTITADGHKIPGPTLNGQRLCSIEGARRFGHLRD